MKFLALLCLALTGCATTLYDRSSGQKIASFQSDIQDGNYGDGTTYFTFTKMHNSVPTRAALLGANKIAGTIGSAAVAIAVPGAGATSMVTKAVISSTPHLTSPAAAPADKSPASIWPTSP